MDTIEYLDYELGTLEIRQRGRVLGGSFPYNRTATRSDRGQLRKERIKGNAFNFQLQRFARAQKDLSRAINQAIDQARIEALQDELDRANVNILVGHNFNQNLGSLKTGARIVSSEKSLDFEIDLPEEKDMPTYYLDAIKQVRLGEVGVSPGFRIPPPDVVPGAQRIVQDPGEAVLTREISEAVLHEISILSRPAVAGSTVELRKEEFDDGKSSSISKWDKFLYLL